MPRRLVIFVLALFLSREWTSPSSNRLEKRDGERTDKEWASIYARQREREENHRGRRERRSREIKGEKCSEREEWTKRKKRESEGKTSLRRATNIIAVVVSTKDSRSRCDCDGRSNSRGFPNSPQSTNPSLWDAMLFPEHRTRIAFSQGSAFSASRFSVPRFMASHFRSRSRHPDVFRQGVFFFKRRYRFTVVSLRMSYFSNITRFVISPSFCGITIYTFDFSSCFNRVTLY